MTEPRDTLVGDALRRIDVPDHAPDFWDRLEGALAGDVPGSDPAAEDGGRDDTAAVIELGAVRTNRRARPVRSARLPAVAAAAAAVAALALGVGLPAAQQAADGESQVDVADGPDGRAVPEPSAPVAAEPVPTSSAPSTRSTPEEVATGWLSALRAGEVDEAYAMLDESSRAVLSRDELREVASGLAEGAGAFADLDRSVIPLIDDEGLAATAVVFAGDVEREGTVESASHAVVVTGDPEDPSRPLAVAFVLDGPTVEAVQRTQPSETRTSPLELRLSPTGGATWAIIDGASPVRIDTGEATVAVDVEALAGPGTHTVAVVSTEAGLYTARSFTIVVP